MQMVYSLDMPWDKAALQKLYWEDRLTQQEIGDQYGVTRERIRQVMNRLGIPRRKHNNIVPERRSPTRYATLDKYLQSRLKQNANREMSGGNPGQGNSKENPGQGKSKGKSGHGKRVDKLDQRIVRRYLPPGVLCAECHCRMPSAQAMVSSIRYPALSMSDVQILCKQCSTLKVRDNITLAEQIDIYNQAKKEDPQVLADRLGLPVNTIRRICGKFAESGPL